MKKILLLVVLFFAVFVTRVWAEECNPSCSGIEECQRKITECQKLIEISAKSTAPHEQKMKALESDIAALDANIKQLDLQIGIKKNQIASSEKNLDAKQIVLEKYVRDFYKKDYSSDLEYLLTAVFAGNNLAETVRGLGYRQALMNSERQVIVSVVLEIVNLADDKKKLEESQVWVAQKRSVVEAVLAPIRDLVKRSKAYQSQLSATVGSLSARQSQLIAQKIGSLNLSRSAGISLACADDRNIDPGFSPRFAFYTFGIPHRVGMSQFGAYGRAKDGQDYKKILNAYFNGVNFEKKGNITMKVQGYSDMALEQYMLGIYEVPDSWPMEALKAQAVAARSYALAYTNNGANSICTTQDCQVYKGGNKGGNWEQAVKQTEGEVMVNGGQVIKAWYSSTDGGYTHTSADVFGGNTAWTKNTRDTNGDVGSISDLFSKAYDRESPCFYNAQGWRTQYNKSAWLKAEEVADIVNVILISGSTNDWDQWDAGKVRSELQNKGITPFNRVDSVSMSFDLGYGKTTSVVVSGDGGSKTFDGKTFKDYFNVRAPANIAIVGSLYNIEKK